MRVIAGTAKGRRLSSPKSEEIRPVLDQVKEAIFNILFDVSERRVLDLFAGTGAMGIEALSRGARHCCFVDNSKEARQLILKNLEHCQMTAQGTVLGLGVDKAIERLEAEGQTFDLIFVDPPYEKGYVRKTLRRLGKSAIIASGGILIVEHHPKEPLDRLGARPIGEVEGLGLTDQRKYGQTVISFLKLKSKDQR